MSVIILNADLMIEIDRLSRSSYFCSDYDWGNINDAGDATADLIITFLLQAPIYYHAIFCDAQTIIKIKILAIIAKG